MKKEKEQKPLTKKRKVWRAIGWATPTVLAIICMQVFKHFPSIVETVFSKGISHFFNSTLGYLISWIPFSLTEALIIVALLSIVFLVGSLLVSFIKFLFSLIFHKVEKEEETEEEKAKSKAETFAAMRFIGWFVGSVYLFYVVAFGLNSYRYPAAQLCDLEYTSYTSEQLYDLCCELADRGSTIRAHLKEDEKGCMTFKESLSHTLAHAGDGYKTLDDRYPFLSNPVTRVKPVLLSHWWSYTGIEGVYFPIFMESNVNIDIPDYAIPASAAHELSHLRGFAKEDECNFFGCLSCFENPSKDYQYSGYAIAYVYCANQLYSQDEKLWLKAEEHLSDGMMRDYISYNTYWEQYQGTFQDVSLSINDSLIKNRGVEDGSKSYDRVVDLLMMSYLKNQLFPAE